MYKIIGADGKEYGPSSAEELRQWFREGRVNGQTMVQVAGSAEWKPLAAYPELASMLSGASEATTPPTMGPTHALAAKTLAGQDYELDILNCISRAWQLLLREFWPVIAVSALVLAGYLVVVWIFVMVLVANLGTNPLAELASAVSVEQVRQVMRSAPIRHFFLLASLVDTVVRTVFFGGLYGYYLKLIRGEPAEMADAFSGFSRAFVPLVLLGVVTFSAGGSRVLLLLSAGGLPASGVVL